MSATINTIGCKKRFQQLASIVIPKIQRDFAYGRANNEDNRKKFLETLSEKIAPGNTADLELDFVFGRYDKHTSTFEPIDGQQRLTILFLLHVYLSKRNAAHLGTIDLDYLGEFRYETRDSSLEFCRKLIAIEPQYFDSDVAQYIKEQWWYTSHWEADPTISSMLVILSHIHTLLKGYTPDELLEAWQNLNTRIDFWFITLDDLGSTDDLYIKMNSRGKKLTDFEHFKAELDRYAGSGEMSMKIDTAWTHMLWPYRKNIDRELDTIHDFYLDNGLNERLHNLFYRLLVIEGAKRGVIEYPEKDSYGKANILELASVVLAGKDNPVLHRIHAILDFFAKQNLDHFFREFLTDAYADNLNDIPASEADYRVYFSEGINLLIMATEDKKMEMLPTLMLEAFLEYAYNCSTGTPIPHEVFKGRLRILRNLQNNLQTHADEMAANMRRVDRIVKLGDVGSNMVDDKFTQLQKAQEMTKLQWRRKHSDAEWLMLLHTENTYFLYGNLAPIMANNTPEVKYMRAFFNVFGGKPALDTIKRGLLAFGDYADSYKGTKHYATSEWLTWYEEIFIFRNKAFTPAFFALADSALTPKCAAEAFVAQCVAGHRYPWRYYLVAHNLIRNNNRHNSNFGLYSKGNGKYDYKMRVGSRGRSWNPYLLQLNALLPGSTLGDYYEPLYYRGHKIDVTNRRVIVYDLHGRVVRFTYIPQWADGTDMVDRVQFALQWLNATSHVYKARRGGYKPKSKKLRK